MLFVGMQSHKGFYSRGYLPHLDDGGLIQAARFHLRDSLPLHVRALAPLGPSHKRCRYHESALDKGYENCWLKDPRVAKIVEDTFLFFEGQRYEMIAWVIMPNHAHVCFRQYPGVSLPDILQSWKGFSGRECNRILQRDGQFWEREYFDRAVRSERQLRNVINYIHGNPVKAGLVQEVGQWRWSSAWMNRVRWPSFEDGVIS